MRGVTAAGWVSLTPVSPCILLCLPLQINMLLQYKGGADEEECPVPEDIRDELLDFHNDLLAHCGETGPPWGTGTPPSGIGTPRGTGTPPSWWWGTSYPKTQGGQGDSPIPGAQGPPLRVWRPPTPWGHWGTPNPWGTMTVLLRPSPQCKGNAGSLCAMGTPPSWGAGTIQGCRGSPWDNHGDTPHPQGHRDPHPGTLRAWGPPSREPREPQERGTHTPSALGTWAPL